MYLEKNPNYEKEQQNRNQELDDVLEQRDGQEVVLYEVTDEETNNKQRKRRSDSRNSSLSEVRTEVLSSGPPEGLSKWKHIALTWSVCLYVPLYVCLHHIEPRDPTEPIVPTEQSIAPIEQVVYRFLVVTEPANPPILRALLQYTWRGPSEESSLLKTSSWYDTPS